MKLRKFTRRKSATGKGYPQCQHTSDGEQCEKPVYADGRCWDHQSNAPVALARKAISTRSRPRNRSGQVQ
jgi:hypothetical protein